MKMPFLRPSFCFQGLCSLLLCSAANAQLLRGPYLQGSAQQATSILWRTSAGASGELVYGLDAANLNQSLPSTAAANGDHEVRITNLQPDTKYYYAVKAAGGTTLAGGPDFFFRTQPVTGTARPFRFWAIGDFGTANINQARVRDAFYKHTESNPVDFILMLGDNAYYTGTDTEYQNAVFNVYPTLLRNTCAWSALGNHDSGFLTDNTPVPYDAIFAFPTNAESGGVATGTERYYSFNHGNIHFVSLDAMTSSRLRDGAQAAWLRADLAANVQPWVIAFWHHPPYDLGTHTSDAEEEQIEMREHMVPILEEYGCDLVLGGHSHVYQRTHLIDGHYGLSGTFNANTHVKWPGDGDPAGDGAYRKPAYAMTARHGCVYAVVGNSGQQGGFYHGIHPANLVNLSGLGSLVVTVNGQRLDAEFIRQINSPSDPVVVADQFSIIKGTLPTPATPLRAPSAPAVLSLPANKVLVAWSDPNGNETGYTLEGSTDGVAWSTLAVLPANTVCTEIPEPAAGVTLHLRAVAVKNAEMAISTVTQHVAPAQAVTETPPARELWWFCQFQGLPGPNAHWEGDPDRDGHPTLVEYACGTHPNSAASAPTLLAQFSDGKLKFSFIRQARAELKYEVEFADRPQATVWQVGLMSVGAGNVAGPVVAVDPATGANARRFARLKVSLLP